MYDGSTADAGTSTTKLYFSTNNTLDASDIYLGNRFVPAIAAGSSQNGSTNVTIPAGIAVGTYYIIAVADSDNTVAEKNETNNIYARSISITQ
nr:CARDB domain-containing protein [Geomonas ferrireducens]